METNKITQWSNANKMMSVILLVVNVLETGLLTNLHLSGVYNVACIVNVIMQHVFISFLLGNSSCSLKHFLIASYHLLLS